ncbi:MAG: CPXCG motif-containing cysteine-rich protein [Deltaproteobacteria bacterium]|nr:CPXCG motif-containing cysteine-rich protein [Deltaproteobacteria bacterium]
MELFANCPYCGELVSLWIDPGSSGDQTYIEDCSVCCRPWSVQVSFDENGEPSVRVGRLDE